MHPWLTFLLVKNLGHWLILLINFGSLDSRPKTCFVGLLFLFKKRHFRRGRMIIDHFFFHCIFSSINFGTRQLKALWRTRLILFATPSLTEMSLQFFGGYCINDTSANYFEDVARHFFACKNFVLSCTWSNTSSISH